MSFAHFFYFFLSIQQQFNFYFSIVYQQLTANPTVLARVFSAILAKGLSAPQLSMVFVIFELDLLRPACTPNLGAPLLSSDEEAVVPSVAICGVADDDDGLLARFVSPL
jgi:hypothetical protein